MFVDDVGSLYVGQTARSVAVRTAEHEATRQVKQILATFEVIADDFNLRDKLRLAEQLVIKALGGLKGGALSNRINAISQTRGRLTATFENVCK